MSQLEGVIGALPTPFDEFGEVDRRKLGPLCDFMASHCDGVSVLGAEISEYAMISPAERRDLLVDGIEVIDGRAVVLAGVSAARPAEVLELAKLAATAGADFAQVLLPLRPSGGPPTRAETVGFVQAVAAESPLPVVLYHHAINGADPSFETLVEICSIDNVVAIKDSSRNISRNLRAVAEIQLAGHAQYLATIQPMLAVMLSGGAGAMTPAGLSIVAAAIRDAVNDGDLARAGRAQALIARFPAAWGEYGLLPLAKASLELLDISAGLPASPYPPVPDRVRTEIKHIIAQWMNELPNLIKGDK